MARDTNNGTQSEPGGIQSVARALSILELFDDKRSMLTTNEIATLTGLNRGTTYRFCQTLKKLGYLDEIGQSTFRPGLKVLSLAQAALGGRELVDMAMPTLQALRHDTGETVNLAVPDDLEVVYVARLLNDDLLALRLVVGSRLPMVFSSLGRSMLAFLPAAEIDRIISSTEMRQLTPHTITDRRELDRRLEQVRQRGFALNDQEVATGVRGIAAPVMAADGRPIAAVNLSIARPLDTAKLEDDLAPRLLAAADDIARRTSHLENF
ncbi:IclR family transcriptional regulator [Kribbella amoyensis]|uniref:IclR family transcriptional regulator n=1 Tax=Kribbella amoyensis TaxID=996641 RepID=UPI0014794436|nr:IclR family transcriptional regulator [Kribbella amoyensis]